MAFLTQYVGGAGGTDFNFDGRENGATLQKICVWRFEFQIKAIKAWLSDGRCMQFGQPAGKEKELIFADGERFTSLSLAKNKSATHLSAIEFKTSKSQDFFVRIYQYEQSGNPIPINVGSGICMGIAGRAAADILYLSFIFLNPVKSALMTNVKYPTLGSAKPEVTVEHLKTVTHHNPSNEKISITAQSPRNVTLKMCWILANKISNYFPITVKAQIPMIRVFSNQLDLVIEREYKIDQTREESRSMAAPFEIPPGKTVEAVCTVRRANMEIPFTGTIRATLENGTTVEFSVQGTYKGQTYCGAEAAVNVK